MKITVDGTVYDFDQARLGMREAYRLQEQTGMNLQRWQTGLVESDVKALAGLVFLLKTRAGETVDWDTFDFDLGSLEIEDAAPEVEGDASDPSSEPEPSGVPGL